MGGYIIGYTGQEHLVSSYYNFYFFDRLPYTGLVINKFI